MAGLAFHRNMLVAELAAHRDALGKAFDGRVPLNHSRRHDRDIVGDQTRIDAVIFRQSAGSASELPQFVRIDPPHREAGCQQDPDDLTLVTAARFQADRGDRTSRQSSEQLSPAGGVVGDAKSSPTGSDCYVQTIDRNIDPDIVRLAHLRTPSLLMRARALATVRVRKIWLERRARPRYLRSVHPLRKAILDPLEQDLRDGGVGRFIPVDFLRGRSTRPGCLTPAARSDSSVVMRGECGSGVWPA